MVFKYHQNWVQIPQFRSAIVMKHQCQLHGNSGEHFPQWYPRKIRTLRIEKLHLHMESLHFYLGRTSIRYFKYLQICSNNGKIYWNW